MLACFPLSFAHAANYSLAPDLSSALGETSKGTFGGFILTLQRFELLLIDSSPNRIELKSSGFGILWEEKSLR